MEIVREKTMPAWKDALRHILEHGSEFVDENSRHCREVMNLAVKVEAPDDAARLVEVMSDFKKWVYPPQSEIAEVMLSKRDIPAYGFCYGARLFSWDGAVDQINGFVVPVLRNNRNSRRAVVTFLDPGADFKIANRQIPGLVLLDFKIRDGTLNVTAFVRSNDFFIGWPACIYQVRVLQKYVAQKLDIDAGYITTFSTSAHIFEDCLEEIKKVLAMR